MTGAKGVPVRWLGIAIGLLTSACVGTETGNPSFTGELSYNTYTSAPAVAALRAPAGGITVESAWLVLGDVRFVSADACEDPETAPVHAGGLGAGDHASPVAPSSPIMLESGDYCSVRLPFERAGLGDVLGAPEALVGHSVLIDMTLADGTPARILSAFEGEVAVDALRSAFALGVERSNLLLGFDVATWLSDIGVETAERSAGAVEVSARQNPDVLAAFEANLATGTGLFLDPQGEGQVNASTQIIAAGQSPQ